MGWFARRSVFRKRWHPRPRPRPLAPLTEAQDLTTLATPREFGVRFTIIDGLVQEVQKDSIVIDDLPTDELVTSVNGQYGDVTIEEPSPAIDVVTAAPTNAGQAGTPGEIRVDSGYIYFCVAANTWRRTAITTF